MASETKSKYCKHCGSIIDADCVVCPKCGKQVEVLESGGGREPIIINNSASSSASAASSSSASGRYRRKLPWYLGTSAIIIIGLLTGGIYWIVGPILRINWRSHN